VPGYFRNTDEFRSAKCCGVGDSAEVSPYGNLYRAVIRHWFRRGVPDRHPAPVGVRLPMAGARALAPEGSSSLRADSP